MRQVTGNNPIGTNYTEISIQVTVNGFSFIVYNHTFGNDGNSYKKVLTKQSFNTLNIKDHLNALNLNVNVVTVIWANKTVELIPADVFYNQPTRGEMYNSTHNEGIVAKWVVDQEVLEQIESLFLEVSHIHFIQTLINDSNVIKVVQEKDYSYIVVMENGKLGNYLVCQIKSAADILYYISKIIKPSKHYRYQVVCDNKSILAALEQHINVNGTLSNHPILLQCE